MKRVHASSCCEMRAETSLAAEYLRIGVAKVKAKFATGENYLREEEGVHVSAGPCT